MDTSLRKIFKRADERYAAEEKARFQRKLAELEARERRFEEADEFGRIHNIETDRIVPNPSQPRRRFEDETIIRLADSIRRYGILQPLTVRRTDGGGFEMVAGERRLRAAKLLGMASVPCLIIRADTRRSAELAIIENIQRENLNMFEQASAIASLIDAYSLTQEDIAGQLSVSQSFVANKLRILRLTQPEREKILASGLTERHARALLRLATAPERLRAIEYINEHSLNVAATEAYIDKLVTASRTAVHQPAPRKLVLKDIRIFYNSIDRAISMVKQAGVAVESTRVEDDSSVSLTIRIPKEANVSCETF